MQNRSDEARRSSAEIVAMSTAMRQRLDERKRKRGKKHKKGTKEDMDDAKRELDMDEHKVSLTELYADLATDPTDGMSTENADKRRIAEGMNILTPPKQTPEWVKYMKEITNFFALLLWIASIALFAIYGVVGGMTNVYLGSVLIFVVISTGTFSYFQNRKSTNLMESFKGMMPTMTTVIRDGKTQKIEATYLVRGDIVILKGGDKVPADCRIVECSDDFQVDNASLTGESEPQKRSVECTDDNPLETKNLCFFGTFIPQGSCTAVIVNIGDGTVMGRIAKLATATGGDMTPIAIEILHFVHIIAYVAISIGITFFIIGFIIHVNIQTNIANIIGIIVSNIPEGLLATMTVCLTLTANRMAKKNVLVKNLESVETLGSTTCICSDKTGTLTQNIMTVANVVYDNKIYNAECSLTPVSNYDVKNRSFQALQRCAALCNNAVFDEESKYEKVVYGEGAERRVERGQAIPFKKKLGVDGNDLMVVAWDTIGDASESAMIKFVQDKQEITQYRLDNVKLKEIPFNSKNKYQVSIHKQENRDDLEYILLMKGAPERILVRCNQVLINGIPEPMTPERIAEIEACQLELSKKGMRVLGFCEKVLDRNTYTLDYPFNTDIPNFPLGEKDVDYDVVPTPDRKAEEPLCFIGLMALIDPPRPQVPPAVELCKSAGIRVIMVTGDHPVTAKAIAHKVGILWGSTKEDIEEHNAKHNLEKGMPGWSDPEDAPAIVVPGWTISLDTPVEEWDRILDHPQIVFARTSPQQKLIIVENCQRRKEIVAVTGDGVNDSPALKKADIGIAMGITGSEVSKEAADMILLDDNFASIVSGVEEGRLIFDNLKKSIAYTITHNIPELTPFLLFIIVSPPNPVASIILICIDLGTDLIPSISFAYEPPEADIMERAPRNAQVDRLVTKKLIHRAYCTIGIIESLAGFYTWLVLMNDYGFSPKIIPFLGYNNNFGYQVLWCKTQGGQYCSVGGGFRNANGHQESYPPRTCGNEYDINATDLYKAEIFWNQGTDGYLSDCQYPINNFLGSGGTEPGFSQKSRKNAGMDTGGLQKVTYQSMQAAWQAGFRPYTPLRSRNSAFFDINWLKADPSDSDIPGFDTTDALFYQFQPLGAWGITNADDRSGTSIIGTSKAFNAYKGQKVNVVALKTSNDSASSPIFEQTSTTFILEKEGKTFNEAVLGADTSQCEGDTCLLHWRTGFTAADSNGNLRVNVMSRQMQFEALAGAQTAYFISIVVCQWGHLLTCKTRWLSLLSFGMKNAVMNFCIFYQLMFACLLLYIPGVNIGMGSRPIRLTHWFPAMPFSIYIFIYEEFRKYWMRSTTVMKVDKESGRVIRYPGWLEYNSYY